MRLTITRKAAERMDDLLLSEEELKDLIQGCEIEKLYVLQEENGHRFCHRKKGCVTFWAEYEPLNEAYAVYDVYAHRIEICENT
jgi:hypothetical protein